MIEVDHRVVDPQPLPRHPRRARARGRGRPRHDDDAGRRDPRPVREPGDRLHRLDGPQPPGDRGPGHLSALGQPPGAGRREGRAVVERVQLLDDHHHLRRRDRLLLRPPAGAGEARRSPRRSCRRASRPTWPPTPRPSARSSGTPSRATARTSASCGRSRTGTSATSSTASRAWPRSPRVGGAPREYQIDLDPNKLRAYGISLGEVYSAVARSNSAVGGRVIHQGNAEYLIRSVGWIENLDDIREHGRRPARERHADLRRATSAPSRSGPAFRRSVLEKDGKEVVGGVVLMRYGENPLEVTRRVKEKITTLQAGPARGGADRPVLRPHAADPQGARDGQRHGQGGAHRLHDRHPPGDGAPRQRVRRRRHAADGDPVQLPDDAALRHLVEHHEPGGDLDLGRHPDRPGGRHGRERGAPPDAPLRPRAGHAATRPRSSSRPAARSGGRSSSRS